MFKPGQIVTVSTRNKNYTEDGFLTCPIEKNGDMRLYETIDLESYPSWNDFKGKSTKVSDGDVVTVCGLIGRPERIRSGYNFSSYDIYEILMNGKIRQVFKHNLFPLEK